LAVYHKKTGAIDFTTFTVSCLANYNGTVIMGDTITGNVYTLFSGFTDDDSEFENFFEGDLSDLDIEELKKTKHLILKGKISRDQAYDVYLDLDNNGYVYVGTISGDGNYVDFGQATSIGSTMVGESTVGGGDEIDVYYYEHALRLSRGKFNRGKLKFVATGVGYASITGYKWHDIHLYGKKILAKYR
jgi:hypothetical protein